jgi:hypothetical protein
MSARAQALALILRSNLNGRTNPSELCMNSHSDIANRILATLASCPSLDSHSSDKVRSPRQNSCTFVWVATTTLAESETRPAPGVDV